MKPLSLEMACLLGIQNEIQAVCARINFSLLKNENSTLVRKKLGGTLDFEIKLF